MNSYTPRKRLVVELNPGCLIIVVAMAVAAVMLACHFFASMPCGMCHKLTPNRKGESITGATRTIWLCDKCTDEVIEKLLKGDRNDN